MSLLTPLRVPVKIYKSDDIGAPQMDRSIGCMATIFKACLVTGYGDKAGAGWTMPFEDTAAGVKVFRPELGSHTDFYLRLSSDTGEQTLAQVYLDMTNANTGDLKLQCDTAFKYGLKGISNKWTIVAANFGFWFFMEGSTERLPINKRGIFFNCGVISSPTIHKNGVALHHTGGTWGLTDTQRLPMEYSAATGGAVKAKILLEDIVVESTPKSYFVGASNITTETILSQYHYILNSEIYFMHAYSSSRYDAVNKDVFTDSNGRLMMCHSTSLSQDHNIYIPVDYWEL